LSSALQKILRIFAKFFQGFSPTKIIDFCVCKSVWKRTSNLLTQDSQTHAFFKCRRNRPFEGSEQIPVDESFVLGEDSPFDILKII